VTDRSFRLHGAFRILKLGASRRRAAYRIEITSAIGGLRRRGITPRSANRGEPARSGGPAGQHPLRKVLIVCPPARNHPMAAKILRHQLAKPAIGWVE
jgi:hypothetical protein